MSIEIAPGSTPHSAKPPTTAKPATNPAPPTPSAAAAPTDQVKLSPQAQALKTLQAMNTPSADATGSVKKTDAELKAEQVFMEGVKKFFIDRMGLDPNKAGKLKINKEALHYILRNTVLGALAPPSLLKEMGTNFARTPPKSNGTLAEVTVEGRDNEPALARVIFDPAAMEKLARLPKKKKDTDRDGLFTHLDLMPGTRTLAPGDRINNGQRFEDVDKRFAKEDETAPKQLGLGVKRIVLSDSQNKPFFMTRLRGDVEVPKEATANVCFSLLQFAGLSPS